MIVSIILWSIQQRILVLLISVVLVLMGINAIHNTPVDAIPDLSDVQVIIKTSFPGQAPQVVEDQVTYPLTSAMLSVPGAKTVRGYSFFGDSYVYVIFDDDTDIYWARSRVLEYLSQVSAGLPASAKTQLGPDATGVGWVYQYALRDTTGQHDIAMLTSIQQWFLKYELQTVEGVAEVASVGGMVKQYQVRVDPDKLRSFGIPLAHVKQAILRGNQETGGSVIELAEAEYMVRSTGYISSRNDLLDIPLRAEINGVALTIADVAQVVIGPKMRRGIAELNGEGETVGGIVIMRYGENALTTIQGIETKLAQLQSSLPNGVEVVSVYSRADLILNSVKNLFNKLIQEFVVVVLVCVVFLGHIRSALVVLVSLPIGILVAFIVMEYQGINANIMSLGGLAIAIGAMVDGAIVMIENVHKQIEDTPLDDDNRWQVIAKAASEVGPALFFSLLIMTLSFLPVFALEAQEGKMFSPLAYTKSYAMAAAAGLAITLVPVLMGYCVRGHIVSQQANPINRVLISGYQYLLGRLLRWPKSTLLAAVMMALFGLYPISQLGSEFIPPLDEGDLMYMPVTYPAISIGKARQILQQTDKMIRQLPEVDNVFGKIGRAETATDPAPLTMIETLIQLKPQREWRPGMTTAKLRQQLDKLVNMPGMNNVWVMPIKTRIDMLSTGVKTPVGIRISGPDLSVIEDIGEQLEVLIQDMQGTVSVYAERPVSGRYIEVDIHRQQAARFGLNIDDIQLLISSAVGGVTIGETVEGLERYPINLRYTQNYRDSIYKLRQLPIVTETNQRLVLEDVATVQVVDGPSMIKTENARLAAWVLIDIDGVDVGGYVTTAQQRIAAQLASGQLYLPAGYSLYWSGQYEYMQRAQAKLKQIIPITLLLIVWLLYLNFRAFAQVMIILITLPFAVGGALWLLWLLDFHLSVAVGVGLIALAGVCVEIGIILLVYLDQAYQQAQQQYAQLSAEQRITVILAGAARRVRPVVMTVATVVVGLLPIMYGEQSGSQIMQRIAAPMLGGMISAMVLTLLVLPVVYLQWRKLTDNP